MGFKPDKQYLLILPEQWMKDQPSSQSWHNQLVTYYKTDNDIQEISYDTLYDSSIGPYTAWVTHPKLKTAYKNNIFCAHPQWLHEVYFSPFTGKLS